MSNTFKLKTTISTTVSEQVEIDVQLPYFSKEAKSGLPWFYYVCSDKELIACCVSDDKKFTAMGLRSNVGEAFGKDKIEITREEFEQVFQESIKLPVNSIPKA